MASICTSWPLRAARRRRSPPSSCTLPPCRRSQPRLLFRLMLLGSRSLEPPLPAVLSRAPDAMTRSPSALSWIWPPPAPDFSPTMSPATVRLPASLLSSICCAASRAPPGRLWAPMRLRTAICRSKARVPALLMAVASAPRSTACWLSRLRLAGMTAALDAAARNWPSRLRRPCGALRTRRPASPSPAPETSSMATLASTRLPCALLALMLPAARSLRTL